LFNICYQVLLLNIELNLQIESIPVLNPEPDRTIGSLAVGRQDPQLPVSKKVFAFADDCNVAMLKKRSSMLKLLEVLQNFSDMSGLECNISKSNFMEIGVLNNDDCCSGCGLEKKNSLKILGMELSNDKNELLKTNGDFITAKINMQIAKWARFNLSLPGRIRIAKSMLLSQINYLGSFLDFNDNWLKK
jgi:hypothetical protein